VRDKLNAVFDAIQGPDDPMLDFDERDLVRLAVDAGFFPVELDLQIEVVSIDAMSWERFVNVAGNPNIPSLAEAMEEALDAGERARLERHLRPLVERGEGVGRWAAANLRATKPG
jgi:arsenite methyltransferase